MGGKKRAEKTRRKRRPQKTSTEMENRKLLVTSAITLVMLVFISVFIQNIVDKEVVLIEKTEAFTHEQTSSQR